MKRLSLLLIFASVIILANNFPVKGQASKDDPVEVATILELREGETDGTVYILTGEAVLTYQQSFRNQKFIEDATAGILIDDNSGVITTSYNVYDGITGITGTISEFGNMVQFVPVDDPGDVTSAGNSIQPLVISLDDYLNNFMDYQSRLVTIENVSFVDPGSNFANGEVYVFTDGEDTGLFRTTFYDEDYIGSPIPAGELHITGLPNSRSDGDYLTARNWVDIETLEAYSVTFDLIDEAEETVANAVITFLGETHDAGDYFFDEVSVGTHPYIINKEGYHTRHGQVSVADDDVVKVVVLVEISDNIVETFPWTEGFESSVPPDTWAHYALGEGEWSQSSTANTGSGAAFHNFTTAGDYADSWLVTPQIRIPEESEGTMLLNFFEDNGMMADYDYSGVMISKGSGNPTHEEFVEIYEASSAVNNYTERTINLADFAGEVIYIAFVYQGEDAHRWFIDDVTIEMAPEAILVDNIAALRDYSAGDLVYVITGEVVITHQQKGYRGQMFIQDSSGAIMIDDNAGNITTEYDNYDGIIDLKGSLSEFQNMLQFVPEEDPGPANSTGNEIEPLEVTLADFSKDLEAMLVIVKMVSFVDPEGVNFTHNVSYEIIDDSGEGVIRTPNSPDLLDYFGTPLPTTPHDLIGVITQRYEESRLLPRSLEDFIESDDDDDDDNGDPNKVYDEVANLFKIYPNPANSIFNISSKQVIDYVRIFNLNGQLIKQESVNSNAISIDITSMNNGIYIVQIVSGDKLLNQKLQILK